MTNAIAFFVINLETRPDRRRDMTRELARVGLSAEFVSAIRPDDAGGFPSVGARGCYLSHLKVLRAATPLGRHVAIMEDDLNLGRGFGKLWPAALRQLPADWSFFYPAHGDAGASGGMTAVPSDQAIRCTHFLIIHVSKVDRVAAELETILRRPPGHPLGGPMHVDGAYSTIRQQSPDLATFIFSPALGYQRPSRSDVEGQKFFDRVRLIEPGISALRRLKAKITTY